MKVIVFTRKDSACGVACAVIAKQAFGEDAKVVLESPETIDSRFIDVFNIKTYYDTDDEKEVYDVYNSDELYSQDRIFIVDLFLKEDLLHRIGRNSVINKKFAIYDCHNDAIKNGAGHYLFNDVRRKDRQDRLTSSANIFYENLIKKGLIKETKKLNDLVEVVRTYETGEETIPSIQEKASDFGALHSAVGSKEFFRILQEKVSTEPDKKIEFSAKEKELIEKYKNSQEPNEE